MKKTFLDKLKEKGFIVYHCKENETILVYDKENQETLIFENEHSTYGIILNKKDLDIFLKLKLETDKRIIMKKKYLINLRCYNIDKVVDSRILLLDFEPDDNDINNFVNNLMDLKSDDIKITVTVLYKNK